MVFEREEKSLYGYRGELVHCFVCWGGGCGRGSIGGDIFVDREELGIDVEMDIKNGDDFDCFQKIFYAMGELN